MAIRPLTVLYSAILLCTTSACAGADEQQLRSAEQQPGSASATPFQMIEAAQFDEPWAMTFLPDGRLLVTEKQGSLQLVELGKTSSENNVGTISGVPDVDYGGQGGLGDVVLHPQFGSNGLVYLSYIEAGEGDVRGAAVARGTLTLDDKGGGTLSGLEVLWRQAPKVTGRGHYGHRIAFGPDGMLWITSGDRQKFEPAQDMQANLGKIIRLNDDGSIPADNPFVEQGGVAAQVWSLGHRNALGIDFDSEQRLWVHEMGPKGGDELNLITRGANYGYPIVSNGNHYDGRKIPTHDTRPEFEAPKITWDKVISPAGMVIYSGSRFPEWQGNAFIGGLSSQALVRVEFDGVQAREAARYEMDNRIREIEQGPDGYLWLLEDARGGSGGKLLKLVPAAG